MREQKQKIIQAFDNGDIDESEARDLLGRVESKFSPGSDAVYRKERAVVDEMHPDLDWKDRLLFKNLSTSPEGGMNEMQKRYPEHKFKYNANGALLMRKADEDTWAKIDTDKGGVMETIRDLGDVAYDVPAALAETAATVTGGTLGATAGLGGGPAAPVTVPAGALAGASSFGAAAGAATEAGRQTLGKMTGFTEEYDTGQIGTAAAFGGASPLLFGSGATTKGVLKAMTKKGLTQNMSSEAAEKLATKVANAQRSVLGRGVGKAINASTPHVAAWASGYTPEVMKSLRKRMSEGLMSVNPAEIPKAFRADMMGAFKAKKDMLGKVYGESLEALDVAIDTRKVEQPIFDLLKQYKQRAEKAVPGFEKLMAEGKQVPNVDVDDFLYLQKTMEPYLQKGRVLEGAEIVNYLDKLKDLSKLRKNVNVEGMSKVDQDLIRITKQIGGDVDKGLDSTLIGKEFRNVKKQYAELFDHQEILERYVKDDKAAEGTLRNLNSQANNVRRDELEKVAEAYGVKLEDYANDTYLMSQFLNPQATGKYLGGTSPLSRSVPLGLATGYAGYTLGQETGMSPYLTAIMAGGVGSRLGSPASIKRMTQMGNAGRQGLETFRRQGPVPQAAIGIYQQINQRKNNGTNGE